MKIRCPRFIKRLFSPATKVYDIAYDKVKRSIRLELIFIFGVSVLAATFLGSIVGDYFENANRYARIDYSFGSRRISEQAEHIVNRLTSEKISINGKNQIEEILKGYNRSFKTIISDLDGKVLYKSENANETQVDIYTTIKNALEATRDDVNGNYSNYDRSKEYISFYPVNFTDGKGYVIVSGVPEGQIVYEQGGSTLPGTITVLVTFLLCFYFMTNKKMKYIEVVSDGLLEISKGNLDYRIEKYGHDELGSLASHINFMAEELKNKIENERKSERAKSELITNVSHDLRTPLTSIKGYLGLIKDKKYDKEEQLDQYINIAFNKSEKLEVLINDLFEYTKLSNKGVNINTQTIALNGLLEQLIDELSPIVEENQVTISEEFINEKVLVKVDPNKTVRVFENLLMNAIRYSIKPGDIKVILTKEEDYALVSVQNKCDNLKEEELEKIFDRFYRVEKSRSSDTGGSGLGLAIAKNIVTLQGGTIEAKYSDNYVSFNVKFKLENS